MVDEYFEDILNELTRIADVLEQIAKNGIVTKR